jgi:hypothetical protein
LVVAMLNQQPASANKVTRRLHDNGAQCRETIRSASQR